MLYVTIITYVYVIILYIIIYSVLTWKLWQEMEWRELYLSVSYQVILVSHVKPASVPTHARHVCYMYHVCIFTLN